LPPFCAPAGAGLRSLCCGGAALRLLRGGVRLVKGYSTNNGIIVLNTS